MQQPIEKVVVTGGAGFIGSHLVDRLLASTTTQVTVFDNLSGGHVTNLSRHHADPRLVLIRGDVRDAAAVGAAVQGARTVYHLAAQPNAFAADGSIEQLDDTFSANVIGTFNVLRAAVRHSVSRVVFASSAEVYGRPLAQPVDEDHPHVAVDAFGASKAAAEVYCRVFQRALGLQVAILRFATVYGPRDRGLVHLWLERAADGEDLHVCSETRVADFIWVGHAVDALVRAATVDRPLPPINIGSGTGTRVIDVARRIVRLGDRQVRIKVSPELGGPQETAQCIADVGRMRHMLQIEPPLDPLKYLPRLVVRPGRLVYPEAVATVH